MNHLAEVLESNRHGLESLLCIHINLSKLLNLYEPMFPICKMGIIILHQLKIKLQWETKRWQNMGLKKYMCVFLSCISPAWMASPAWTAHVQSMCSRVHSSCVVIPGPRPHLSYCPASQGHCPHPYSSKSFCRNGNERERERERDYSKGFAFGVKEWPQGRWEGGSG